MESPKILRSFRGFLVAATVIVLTLVVAVSIVLNKTDRGSQSILEPSPSKPGCSSDTATTSPLVLTIRKSGPVRLHPDCLYSAKDRSFRLTFKNLVTALEPPHRGIVANVSIYPAGVAPYKEIDGGYVVDGVGAVFRGRDVVGPGVTVYSVPALKAGIYRLQSDSHPDRLFATLIVR
jgi:hypothetical protein